MSQRKTSMTLPKDILEEARALGINISRAARLGIRQEIDRKRQEQLKEELRKFAETSNAYVVANGLPLTAFRRLR